MRLLLTVVIAVTAVAVYVTGTGPALAGAGAARHVVDISGSPAYGFDLGWSDGRRWWTPTLSETLAECGEHDRAGRRSRCKGAARARYRWMGVLKRSLRHHGER
jgi:hypothetical protein